MKSSVCMCVFLVVFFACVKKQSAVVEDALKDTGIFSTGNVKSSLFTPATDCERGRTSRERREGTVQASSERGKRPTSTADSSRSAQEERKKARGGEGE